MFRKALLALGLAMILVTGPRAEGGDPTEHLFELTGRIAPTATSTLTTRYTNLSVDFLTVACSYSLVHDSEVLTVIDVQTAPALEALEPDFLETTICPDGVTFGLLVDFSLMSGLAPGPAPYPLQAVTYESSLLIGEQTTVCFESSLGSPYPIAFVVSGSTGTTLYLDDACTTFTAQAPGGFTRGDLDASGVIDAVDADRLLSYLLPESAETPFETPVACDGAPEEEACDVNDNEFLTLADYLLLRDAQQPGAPSIPGPAACGPDSTSDVAGFETIDAEYSISIGNPYIVGEIDETHGVFLPVNLDYPGASVRGFSVAFSLEGSTLEIPADGIFWQAMGESRLDRYPDRFVLTVFAGPGEVIYESAGNLVLELNPFEVFPPLAWLPDVELTAATGRTIRYRATVVDMDYLDHHPQLIIGEYEFVRGNANGDTAVDISDAISILDYLFAMEPGPYCFDAGDVNNDSAIDIGDSIYLLSFLFAGGPVIPQPYPQCGFDEGQIDLLGCAPPGDACD